MAYYEMPQSLKHRYRERIDVLFLRIPMDYLKYLVILIVLCLAVLKWEPVNETVTYGLTLGVGVFGVFLIQMGDEKVKTEIDYRLRKDKHPGWFDPGLRKFIKINKIEKGTVFLRGGKLRAILLTSSINFTAWDERQISAFNDAMSEFLDSLDYPIQWVVRSVKLNMDSYFAYLDGRLDKKNGGAVEMYDDFKDDSRAIIEGEATNNKIYLTTIPYDKGRLETEKNALEALEIRVETSRKMLARAGVITSRLNDDRLIALLSGYFGRYAELDVDYLSWFTYPEHRKMATRGKNVKKGGLDV